MPKKITEANILKQKEILQKIYEILGISSEKKSFILQDMDVNEEAQEQIYELEPEIKENFICGTWSCFTKTNQDRKWYNIIKSVCKNNNVVYYTKRKTFKKDDNITYATEVIIECD
jgi:hypothetical protein